MTNEDRPSTKCMDHFTTKSTFWRVNALIISLIAAVFGYLISQQAALSGKLEAYQDKLFQELKEVRNDINDVSNDISEINGFMKTLEVVK